VEDPPGDREVSIQVVELKKNYGTFAALAGVSLKIESGELVALLGPSGSGKTTLLRMIAGLETPDSGAIQLNGEDATQTTVRERQVGFVFQHYALFRHLTVFENVAFGLRLRPKATRLPEAEIRARVKQLLDLIQLNWLADRYPNQLSGGQRQRVALARTLAVEPRVLLLDEPFGALDAKVRKELRRWLRKLHDELHITSVFVTHDQEEALEVSDRVAIMNQGRIEQVGSPIEVYDNPVNAFVYEFLGDVNLFHERVESSNPDRGAVAYVRPHELGITRNPSGSSNDIRATIRYVASTGPTVRIELERSDNGQMLEAEIPREKYRELQLAVGDLVGVSPRNLRVFPQITGTYGDGI
jgi:sulfate transport system ATP-binding protein